MPYSWNHKYIAWLLSLSNMNLGACAQSCPTLRDPVDCSLPGSMGFPRQGYWNGQPFPLPGRSSQSRDRTRVSYVFHTGRQVLFQLSHQGIPWFLCSLTKLSLMTPNTNWRYWRVLNLFYLGFQAILWDKQYKSYWQAWFLGVEMQSSEIRLLGGSLWVIPHGSCYAMLLVNEFLNKCQLHNSPD